MAKPHELKSTAHVQVNYNMQMIFVHSKMCRCISPVEPDSGSMRLLLHGWNYVRQHLAMMHPADIFIDFNMQWLLLSSDFPTSQWAVGLPRLLLDTCMRQRLHMHIRNPSTPYVGMAQEINGSHKSTNDTL